MRCDTEAASISLGLATNHKPNTGSEVMNDSESQIVFDPDVLVAYVGPDLANLKKHFQKFHRILEQDRITLQQAFADKDPKAASDLAHRIKSSSRMVGAPTLADICEQIEHDGRHASRLDDEHLASFLDLSDKVLKAVDEYLSK